jgi:hypothetical protein
MTAWDMAGLRQRTYAAPKPRKPLAPVGDDARNLEALGSMYEDGTERSCRCGYHVCSCLRDMYPAYEPANHTEGYIAARAALAARSVLKPEPREYTPYVRWAGADVQERLNAAISAASAAIRAQEAVGE